MDDDTLGNLAVKDPEAVMELELALGGEERGEAETSNSLLTRELPSFIEGITAERDILGEILDDACVAALEAIGGRRASVKREAVIQMALGRAFGRQRQEVLAESPIVSETSWGRYRLDPVFLAAYELVLARALHWRNQETTRIEEAAMELRARALAIASLEALEALVKIAQNSQESTAHRLKALRLLLAMGDQMVAQRIALVERGVAIPLTMEQLDATINRDLARLAGQRQADGGGAVAYVGAAAMAWRSRSGSG